MGYAYLAVVRDGRIRCQSTTVPRIAKVPFSYYRDETTGVTSNLYKLKLASELIHVEDELKSRVLSFIPSNFVGD
jgi:hypothetical protein